MVGNAIGPFLKPISSMGLRLKPMRWGLLLLMLLALGCRGQQLPGPYQQLERALQQQDVLTLALSLIHI